jgi:PAS domain S-box-containing protein
MAAGAAAGICGLLIPLSGCSGYEEIVLEASRSTAGSGAAGTGTRWPTVVSVGAGAYALLTGLATLAGWAADLPRLTDWNADGISMFPNTAACAAVSGLCLLLLTVGGARVRGVVRALASLVATIGGVTLLEHLVGFDAGIDTLLLERPWGQVGAVSPMRMGPPASTAFLAAGVALILLANGPRGRRASAALGTVIVVLGTLSLTGYLFGASQLYTLPRLTAIALQTALVLVAVGFGIVACVRDHEPMRTLADRGAAGVLVRQSLPFIVVGAFALSTVRIWIERKGFVDAAFGTALRTVVELIMVTGVLWWAAARVRAHERVQVTERRSADETRARLAAIVESSEDAIISKDLDGVITSWNQAAERLFGYTAAEAVGRPITMLIPAERLREEPAILDRIRAGERVEHFETVRVRRDGTLLDVSLTISPLRDSDGHVTGASKIARDITEWKRTQRHREELLHIAERAREEAEAASRAKDDFLAMLGHELRNPLSAVRNAISAATLDERSRVRALTIARRQADQLTRIVDDLLDVARITRGRVPLRKERISLAGVLQRSVDGARSLMEERGHTLTLFVPSELVVLDADPARLEQAVANLLTNAAKYTDPGGKVVVSGGREGTDAVVRVRDNGIGIAADLLPWVFDLFKQGARALDRAQGGLGIGLTLVRRIVERHGGTVEAHSPGAGGGAEFVIRLPALPRESGERADAALDAQARTREQHPARVLMVEDNPDAAESLVMLLELLGHNVRVVHDGLAALEAATANVPDIMLVDIGLPGLDGYEVARSIRREPALRNIVLVALTGYGRPEDKAQAMAAGFDYHLVKPVDLEALGELVAQLGSPVRTGGGPATWH